MADFNLAYKLTSINEGGLANNKKDKGKFTYAGIASAYWPDWDGWDIVLKVFKEHGSKITDEANKELKQNKELQTLVKNFYLVNFWNALNLSHVNDQQVANNVYDFGVNSGVFNAAKKLQISVNDINRQGTKLKVDGAIGNLSIQAINNCRPVVLYQQYNIERERYYRSLDDFDTFGKIWLSRLTNYKIQ